MTTDTASELVRDVPLKEAPRHFGDPSTWESYITAAGKVTRRAPPIRSSVVASHNRDWHSRPTGMSYSEFTRLVRERDRLRRNLVRDVLEKLRAGTLVATGYVCPVQPDAKPTRIPAGHWAFLRPNFRDSSAEGGGLRLIEIRMRCSGDVQDASEIVPEDIPIEAPRPAGRPSRMREILAEMKRRNEAGKLAGSHSAECRALALWDKQRHSENSYKADSLRKPTRALYNELRGEKR